MNVPQHVSMDSRPDLKREERERIERQMRAFLRLGGKITQVDPTCRAISDDHQHVGTDYEYATHKQRQRAMKRGRILKNNSGLFGGNGDA